MSFYLILVAVLAGITLAFYLLVFRTSSFKTPSIPGPKPVHPQHGNLDDVKQAGSLHEYIVHLHKTYGPVASFWWGKTYTVSVACPRLWKDVKSLFDKPNELFMLFEPLFGKKSLQYMNGPRARQLRQVTDRNFSHDAIMNYFDYFLEGAKERADEWSSLPRDQHIPITENMLSLSIKSIGRAGLGKTFTNEKEVSKFAYAYTTCWYELETQLGTPAPDEGSDRQKAFEEGNKYMRTVVKDIIQARRNYMDQNTEKLFIDSMIECDNMNGQELEDTIMTFLIGGFHTTASMMTWCFYYLAIHPEIQEKVYQELIGVLGDEDIVPLEASKLQYCRQVLDETLRCGIVGPWGARVECDHDLKIADYVVPKKTPIMTPFGAVFHDPNIYPEPQRFDPDRFSPENVNDRPSLAFQPFGFAGKRKCPAWRFSIAEGLVFMSVFFRRFKIELVKGQKIEPVYRFVTIPKEEVWITLSKREQV